MAGYSRVPPRACANDNGHVPPRACASSFGSVEDADQENAREACPTHSQRRAVLCCASVLTEPAARLKLEMKPGQGVYGTNFRTLMVHAGPGDPIPSNPVRLGHS